MKNWLWVIIGAFFISIGFCSCSDETEGDSLYSIGIGSMASSSSNLLVEVGRINAAFVAEFGGETFILGGDKSKNDRDVVERFNKVVANYEVASDFVGHIDFSIARNGESIALHRFENHIYTYDLAWADMSPDVNPVMMAEIGVIFETQLNSNSRGEYKISGANEVVCDEKVKALFNQIGSSVELPDDWTGYCVFTTGSAARGTEKGVEVASYRFEKR